MYESSHVGSSTTERSIWMKTVMRFMLVLCKLRVIKKLICNTMRQQNCLQLEHLSLNGKLFITLSAIIMPEHYRLHNLLILEY